MVWGPVPEVLLPVCTFTAQSVPRPDLTGPSCFPQQLLPCSARSPSSCHLRPLSSSFSMFPKPLRRDRYLLIDSTKCLFLLLFPNLLLFSFLIPSVAFLCWWPNQLWLQRQQLPCRSTPLIHTRMPVCLHTNTDSYGHRQTHRQCVLCVRGPGCSCLSSHQLTRWAADVFPVSLCVLLTFVRPCLRSLLSFCLLFPPSVYSNNVQSPSLLSFISVCLSLFIP